MLKRQRREYHGILGQPMAVRAIAPFVALFACDWHERPLGRVRERRTPMSSKTYGMIDGAIFCGDGFGSWRQCKIALRSEEHTSELQSLMRISYAVFCLKKKKTAKRIQQNKQHT